MGDSTQMRSSEKAWVALAAGVVIYDAVCPEGESLSEGVDRALKHPRYRLVTIGAVWVVSAHLLNALPQIVDPIHIVFASLRNELETTLRRQLKEDRKKLHKNTRVWSRIRARKIALAAIQVGNDQNRK